MDSRSEITTDRWAGQLLLLLLHLLTSYRLLQQRTTKPLSRKSNGKTSFIQLSIIFASNFGFAANQIAAPNRWSCNELQRAADIVRLHATWQTDTESKSSRQLREVALCKVIQSFSHLVIQLLATRNCWGLDQAAAGNRQQATWSSNMVQIIIEWLHGQLKMICSSLTLNCCSTLLAACYADYFEPIDHQLICLPVGVKTIWRSFSITAGKNKTKNRNKWGPKMFVKFIKLFEMFCLCQAKWLITDAVQSLNNWWMLRPTAMTAD